MKSHKRDEKSTPNTGVLSVSKNSTSFRASAHYFVGIP